MYKQNAGRAHQIDLLHRIALWPVREQWLLCCSWNGVYLKFVFASLFQFLNLFKMFVFYLHHFEFANEHRQRWRDCCRLWGFICLSRRHENIGFFFLKYYFRRWTSILGTCHQYYLMFAYLLSMSYIHMLLEISRGFGSVWKGTTSAWRV